MFPRNKSLALVIYCGNIPNGRDISINYYYTSLKCFSYTGAFGKVFEGLLNDSDRNMVDVTVAIKTIKSTITLKHICTQY